MKITKQSERIIDIRKTTEFGIIIENQKGKELEIFVSKYILNEDYDYGGQIEDETNYYTEGGKEITTDGIQAFLGDNDQGYDDFDEFNDYIEENCPDTEINIADYEDEYQTYFNGIIKLWKNGDPEPLDGDEVDKLCKFIKKEINKIEANN